MVNHKSACPQLLEALANPGFYLSEDAEIHNLWQIELFHCVYFKIFWQILTFT